MSAGAPAPGLAGRLVDWMAVNRDGLDALMAQEGSRAIHEEFLMAEGGALPDRAPGWSGPAAPARAPGCGTWARGLEAEWDGAEPGLSERVERWSASQP